MEVGKYCEWPECHRLDFLPFQCDFCKKTFCKDHSYSEKHQCENVPDRQVVDDIKLPTRIQEVSSKLCLKTNCQEKICTQCPKCDLEFCLGHRHEKDHNCRSLEDGNYPEDQMPKTKKVVEDILEKNAQKGQQKKTLKDAKLAAKVQLMKLKMNSTGSKNILDQDRVYFCVHCGSKSSSKNVFVDKNWPVGKVVDVLADSCGLENRNNVENAPKLRLYRLKNKQLLVPSDMLGQNLHYFVTNELVFNGETVLLDYEESNF